MVNALAEDDPCSVPQPTPSDDANFISDLSIPDGTTVSPSQSLTKTWRVRNSGTTTWGSGYKLAFVGGEKMGGPDAMDVASTAPGQTRDLSFSLTAPAAPGNHAGYWQLRNPQGTYFGPKLSVKINVAPGSAGNGHITAFDATPGSPSSASSVHLVGRAKRFSDFRAMRFVIGTDNYENTNIRNVGDQVEISMDWNTSSLNRGTHALVLEVAKNGDNSWSNPERRVINFTLTGTPASSNHAPDRPVLKSPYNWFLRDAAGASTQIQMCVNPSSDPDGNAVLYWFELNTAQNSGWISSTCWNPTLSPGNYSWHVKSGDGSASSDWSEETWNFTVASGGVSIDSLDLYSLNNNETHICSHITYGGVNAPEVRAFINSAADGTENGEWVLLDGYGPAAGPDCTASNTWGFWIRSPNYTTGNHLLRINAIKRDSGASATRMGNYTIAYMKPQDPGPILPSTLDNNGTWWNNRAINFQWQASLRAQSYTVRASTREDLWNDPSPVYNQVVDSNTTATSYTFSSDYAKLYWGVRATNGQGSSSSNGATWFGIDRVNPTCQVTTAGTTYENAFQVNWLGADNAAGVGFYNIQYLDSWHGVWSDWLLNQPSGTTYEIFNGQPGHSYSFRCQAVDRAGNSSPYPAGPDTTIKVDPASRPPITWWNNHYSGKRTLTLLNRMGSNTLPSGYPVHIRFDSGTNPTAAEIYNASQSSPKCNDLRVVRDDTTELNRVVQSCSSSLIDIWFRSAVDVGGSSSNTSHALYFGNPSPGSPPADASQVWYPYREGDSQYMYYLQEGAGSSTADASGNGRNCSIDSSVQWVEGKFGNALKFNRANSGNSQSLNCGSASFSAFSIEFWFRPESGGGGRIAGQLGSGGRLNWLLQDFDGQIRLDVWPCSSCGSQEVRSDYNLWNAQYVNRWNHVAVTFNGGNEVKFYVNGSHNSTKYLNSNGINTNSVPLQIGSVEGGAQIKESIGAFRLSSGVKTNFWYGSFASITTEPTITVGSIIQPPASGTPDLAILDMQSSANPSGGQLIQVTVKNQGTLTTTNGFFTELYLDHVPTGTGDYTGSLSFWVSEPIAAGGTATLSTVVADLPSAETQALAALEERTGTFYAQADSTGAIPESNRANNLYTAGKDVCVAGADEYEGDESAGQAQWIELGETQTHNFTNQPDQDWVKFTAQAGYAYTLETSALAENADTYLYLYDRDGSTLLSTDDDSNQSLASSITWAPEADGTYYAMVKSWNPITSGCGTRYDLSLERTEIPVPLAFGKSSPARNAEKVPVSVSLEWGGSTNATVYDYCVDKTDNNQCDLAWETTSSTGATVAGLDFDTQYFWQARARNTAGTVEADRGAWWTFMTQTEPPGSFSKIEPVNGDSGLSFNPLLSWSASARANSYEYCLDTSNNDQCDAVWWSTGAVNGVFSKSLKRDTLYYWQVRAVNQGGFTEADLGKWGNFRTRVDGSYWFYLPVTR